VANPISNQAPMTFIDLTTRQHISIVEEYWSTNYDGRPHMDVTSEIMYNWIAARYNCTIHVKATSAVRMIFEDDKDVTFFLLNHS
jgi:hypothetical protein